MSAKNAKETNMSNQEIDPWAEFPQINKEVPTTLEGYKAEVLAGKTYITAEMFEAAGYKAPFIDTGSLLQDQLQAATLLDQGLPCFLKFGGEWEYTLQAPSVAAQAVKEISTEDLEIASEEAYWSKNPNRLKSVADMLKTPEIDWLVEDKVHSKGLFQMFGASYAGKTLLVLDLVMSWCAGLDTWQGYKLNNGGKPQDALYVAAEGGAALSVHVDAWLKHNGIEPERLTGLKFLDGGEGDHVFLSIGKKRKDEEGIPFVDSWERLDYELGATGIRPSLVVFDTQIDIAPGIDENSNTDMVGILREIKRLGDSLGFMAIVVHHTGHDGNKARGASGMMGKCDAQAKLETLGDRSGQAKLTWTKVKGRAIPRDSISYHIKGWELLPDLDSEGAVCVPLTPKEIVAAITQEETSMGATITKHLSLKGKASERELAELLDVSRNAKEFKTTIEQLLYNEYILRDGSGRSSGFIISPTFHDDHL